MKRKAASELSDKKLDRERVDNLVTELRSEVCILARQYYSFLIEGIRKHVSMTTNNVRGMACFDPHVMCEMPLEFATGCFNDLYRGFKLRGWVQDTSEQACRDEYISVLTHLRGTRASLSSSPIAIHDVIDFLSALPVLKERQHLSHLFRLSCLCLTSQAPSLPPVSFGNISLSNLSCRSIDVILPGQSFFSNLPQGVPICTSDNALDNVSTFCLDFGETGLDPS